MKDVTRQGDEAELCPRRILALAKYGGRAASTRQRLLQYSLYLAKNEVDVELHPLLDDRYLKRLADGERQPRIALLACCVNRLLDLLVTRRFDVVWVQYELFPYLPFIDGLFAKLSPRPIVYDIDDAIFHMYDAHPSTLIRRVLGGKLVPLLRKAAVCLCGNDYLAEYVRAAGGRAIVIPTVVDTDRFRPVLRTAERPVTIGWMGSPSTWRYVEPLLPALLPAISQLGARFHVVGAGPAARGIAGIDAVEWEEAREIADLQAMDIGLMPVPDEPWARGKCGYKLIQYMACGVPGIASPVGVNNVIVDHGVDGFLARTEREWVSALQQLARDPDLRASMGRNGRAKIVESYSLRSQQPVVLSALRNAIRATR